MRFDDPLLLLALVPLVGLFIWDRKRRRSRSFAGISWLPKKRGWRAQVFSKLPWVWLLAGVFLVVALARPQTGATKIRVRSEGIDIILALDVSGSMKAEDFKPDNRLRVAQRVASKFIQGRNGDRIGLVVFAGGAYTQCPLTLDYNVLQDLLSRVDFGQPDGTAIGMALATATNRLRQAEGDSKVVILLTDGQNNAGEVDPLTASEAAQAMGVRVYTIGAGTKGRAQVPVDDPVFGRRYVTIDAQLDEETLRAIAERTGGKYFRATSAEALESIYDEIDALETSEADTYEYVQYNEKGPGLALIAALCLGGALLAAETVGNRIP